MLLLVFLLFGMLKNKMKFKNLKILLISILFVNLSFFVNAKPVPGSFADLAEKLTPSVVYISTTQTVVTNINPFPFELQLCHHNLYYFFYKI